MLSSINSYFNFHQCALCVDFTLFFLILWNLSKIQFYSITFIISLCSLWWSSESIPCSHLHGLGLIPHQGTNPLTAGLTLSPCIKWEHVSRWNRRVASGWVCGVNPVPKAKKSVDLLWRPWTGTIQRTKTFIISLSINKAGILIEIHVAIQLQTEAHQNWHLKIGGKTADV